jgi:hypothetical protein
MALCEDCRKALNEDFKSAKQVEGSAPDCCCEEFSVGVGSPGRVDDHEVLYRMFTDPVDVDKFGRLAREAFSSAYKNGLSIIRECASDDDVKNIVSDILSVKQGRPFKKILAIFQVGCVSFRHFRSMYQGNLGKAFCVYDQTVPRMLDVSAPPVPTHGTVLSRSLFELPKTRKQFENDCNDALHRMLTVNPIPIDNFRNGLVTQLNNDSLQGRFVRQ